MAATAVVRLRIEIVAMLGISVISAAMVVIVMCLIMRKVCRMAEEVYMKKEVEVIEIEDSPLPTKMKSTPRTSPFLTHGRLRRAGKKRLRCHRKKVTMHL